MGIIQRFCCGCNVRSGSVFCAIYTLVSSAVLVAMILVRYVGFNYVHSSSVHAVMVYFSMSMYGLLCLFAILLVLGIHLDMSLLLMPWVLAEICCMITTTVALCWIDVVQVRMENDLHTWEICIMVFHLINMAVSTYCVFCVISQLQDLKRGRGTLEWYKQMERRRRRHMATGSFAIMIRDMNHPPLDGVTNLGMEPDRIISPSTITAELPPYSEEPPPYTTLPRGHREMQELSGVPELMDHAGSPRVVRLRDRARSPLPEVHRLSRPHTNSHLANQHPAYRGHHYGHPHSHSHSQTTYPEPPPAYSTTDRRVSHRPDISSRVQRNMSRTRPEVSTRGDRDSSGTQTDPAPPYTCSVAVN